MKNSFLFLFILVAIIALIWPAVGKMNDIRNKNVDYQRQIDSLTAKNVELTEELRKLKEDPVYLEKVAREKMGLVKEGEMIYKLEPVDATGD